MSQEIAVQIKSGKIPVDILQQNLDRLLQDDSIRWESKKKSRFRVLDPVTLAIIGAAGTAITAFITGLLKVVAQMETQRISISDKAGNKIEIPVAVMNDPEKIEELAKILKKMESPIIHL